MRLSLKGKNFEITPGLRRLVEARLEKLERKYGDALVSAQCVLSEEKNRLVAELMVHARQDHILHGVGSTGAWGTSLTAAVQKVVQQADTLKGKWQGRKRAAASVRTLPPTASVRAPRSRSRRRA
ncbi:MAG TPA: HPF/RaiA family ribosome-associated protein [Vicinamibacterales bacterium]|nr:HPF/RaiA family ribosome-associated protein [Vicinamibacterales bacterium]